MQEIEMYLPNLKAFAESLSDQIPSGVLSLPLRNSLLRNYQVLLLFEPRPSRQFRAFFILCLPPVIWFIADRCCLYLFLHSSWKIQKQLALTERAQYFHYLVTAFTPLACQPLCLSKCALTETPLFALFHAHYLWSLQPLEIFITMPLLPTRKRKFRKSLSQGPKSLNVWTKIQTQIYLENISPLFQSTLFLMKGGEATLLNNRRSAITRRNFLEMNPADVTSKFHKYQREAGKLQVGNLPALYLTLQCHLC